MALTGSPETLITRNTTHKRMKIIGMASKMRLAMYTLNEAISFSSKKWGEDVYSLYIR